MKLNTYLILAFFLSIGIQANSQKTILVEKLTNAFCGACPNASIILDELIESHPNAILVKHHKPVDFTDNPLTNPQSGALWNDLNIPGPPMAMIDRKPIGNSVILFSGQWADAIAQTAATENEGEVWIEDLAYDKDSRLLNFTIKANLKETSSTGPFRLTAMIVESEGWGQPQYSYFNDVQGHPLEGLGDIIWGYKHENVVRDILEDHWGIAGILDDVPDPALEYEYSFSYEIPEDYKPERISIVATINQHGASLTERKVLNATQLELKNMGLGLTTATEDLAEEFSFQVFPNPVAGRLQAEFEKRPESLTIYNAQGKALWTGQADGKFLLIDNLELENGSYFLSAQIDGQTKAKPFLVLN